MKTNTTKLIVVKVLHTIIWAIMASMICYIIYAGLSGNITPFVYISFGTIMMETAILASFRWCCPLTLVASKYSDSNQPNFDIYLPVWLAKHNKTIFSILFVAGVALVVWRRLLNH